MTLHVPTTCDRIKTNAALGTYVLKVGSADSDVLVGGARSVNGVEVQTWTHAQLFNKPQPFDVAKGERHQIIVNATFTGGANAAGAGGSNTATTGGSNATVTVVVTMDDQPVAPPCTLTRQGDVMAAIAVLAPKA
jgi:hypothetical protein